jgi:hypothetical protein
MQAKAYVFILLRLRSGNEGAWVQVMYNRWIWCTSVGKVGLLVVNFWNSLPSSLNILITNLKNLYQIGTPRPPTTKPPTPPTPEPTEPPQPTQPSNGELVNITWIANFNLSKRNDNNQCFFLVTQDSKWSYEAKAVTILSWFQSPVVGRTSRWTVWIMLWKDEATIWLSLIHKQVATVSFKQNCLLLANISAFDVQCYISSHFA